MVSVQIPSRVALTHRGKTDTNSALNRTDNNFALVNRTESVLVPALATPVAPSEAQLRVRQDLRPNLWATPTNNLEPGVSAAGRSC
jgi:hypothetical protein